jgi:hypothetical protein
MSKRILVVEDQPDNRQIIRDMLALSSSCPFLADAGSCPGNCSGMKKQLERQAHSRSIGRGGCGLPVETGAMA